MSWIIRKTAKLGLWAILKWADRQGQNFFTMDRADEWRDIIEDWFIQMADKAEIGWFKHIKSDTLVLLFAQKLMKSNAIQREREARRALPQS